MTEQNWQTSKSFSHQVPKLQLAWDQTSIGMLKTCPRMYQYSLIYGFGMDAENVHLFFGSVYHASLERYDHTKAEGKSHDEGVLLAVDYLLRATWDTRLKRPWISTEPSKNRLTLLRAVVWYLDNFRDDPLETIILANGQPAVELSFQFESGIFSSMGEQYILAGHLDRLVTFNDHNYISDRKTTGHQLGDTYFEQYTPDNQFSLYPIAGQVAFEVPVKGIIVDAVEMGATYCRFERREIGRDKYQLAEYLHDLSFWLKIAEMYAKAEHWPMNDKACFRCHFRPVCSKSPSVRDDWLRAKFKPRVWDPLTPRGNW